MGSQRRERGFGVGFKSPVGPSVQKRPGLIGDSPCIMARSCVGVEVGGLFELGLKLIGAIGAMIDGERAQFTAVGAGGLSHGGDVLVLESMSARRRADNEILYRKRRRRDKIEG